MDSCIFCKIVKGEVPSYKVYEDDNVLVLLDTFPAVLGQVLVIPKEHSENYVFNMNEGEFLGLMKISRKIAKAIDRAIEPVKTGMVIEGMEVDHVHVKLYPMTDSGLELKPMNPLPGVEEMEEIRKKIADAILQ